MHPRFKVAKFSCQTTCVVSALFKIKTANVCPSAAQKTKMSLNQLTNKRARMPPVGHLCYRA